MGYLDTKLSWSKVPNTWQAKCQTEVEAEVANVARDNCFLSFVQQLDLWAVFGQLRQVS